MKPSRKFYPSDLWLVGGIALLVRIIYVSQLAATPFFQAPIIDAEYHDAWAREILRLGIGHEQTFFRAPLYPYFLALVYSLTHGSFFAARLAQALLGTSTALLTYLLALQLNPRRGIALIAGLGTALYGMLVFYDGELLVETLFIPLLLSACLIYSLARQSKYSFYLVLAGLFLGLAAITRASALILVPIFILDLFWPKLKKGDLPRSAIKSFIFLTGCFLPIIPVTYHNVHTGGDFVLIASQGGINFYIGNNASADGVHANLPGVGSNWDVPGASALAFEAKGKVLKSSEVSDYYYQKGWQFVFEQPSAWAKLMLKKLCAFWNKLEISNNRDLYFFRYETSIMPLLRLLGFWIVAPLGLLGMLIGWQSKLLPGWFLSVVPVYMAGVIFYFVTARFRVVIVPFMLIFAGLAIYELLEKRQPFLQKERLINLGVLLLFGFFVNTNPWGFSRENSAHSYFSLGNAYLKSGNYPKAFEEYHAALQADSTFPQVHLNLGVLAYQQGNLEGAAEEYERELGLYPNDARATNNLGVIRFEQGKLEEARGLYEKAADLKPYYQDAIVNLAGCYFKMGLQKATGGDTRTAAEDFGLACRLDDSKALYHYNYALALGRLGQLQTAINHLKKAIIILPDFEEALHLLKEMQTAASGDTTKLPQE
ncbi:MAG: tetratricopeptide repeat protein [bacterium]|nr:tetratricopeptide repeat protein [bacterium]